MNQFCSSETDYDILGETRYDLFALTVHHGSINSGHYVAYVNRD